MLESLVWSTLAFFISYFLNYFYFKSKIFDLKDSPNHRSMHTIPVKKSSGIVVLLSSILFFTIYTIFQLFTSQNFELFQIIEPYLLFFIILISITVLGLIDDIKHISPIFRIFLEIILIGSYLFYQPNLKITIFGIELIENSNIIYLLCITLFFTFLINLSNFMDGLDFYLVGTFFYNILASLLTSGSTGLSLIGFILLASWLGFAVFNWSPAKLFMGDSGSLSLGFLIIFSPILLKNAYGSTIIQLENIFLFIPFFIIDGVVTIIIRIFKKENILKAHNQHLYQILARKFGKTSTTSVFLILLGNLPFLFFLYLGGELLQLSKLEIILSAITFGILFYSILRSVIKEKRA